MNTMRIVLGTSLVVLAVGILCPDVFGLDGGGGEYGGAILKAEGDNSKP